LRRSIWEQVPYPELDYGEDQAWAQKVIHLGYEKVYVPSAAVFHSHDFDPDATFARADTEAFFFAQIFGYKLYNDSKSFDEQLQPTVISDTAWAKANCVSPAELQRQLLLDKARLLGHMQGTQRARANFSQRAATTLFVGEASEVSENVHQ
jgi:hypothetical protein